MSSSEKRLLDAAERIVLREGALHLTLEAVAAESGLSKGGLLYHFRSKDDLVRAMIRRLHEEYEAEVERLAAADPNPCGRLIRAMLHASFPARRRTKTMRLDQLSAGLMAAAATNPKLLDGLREQLSAMEKRMLNDGLPPVTAMVIHAAADGLWLSGLFGFHSPTGPMRRKVIDRLVEMTQEGVCAASV